MPDHDVLPEVLVRFLDHPVAAPPLADIRTKGAAVRRRRRRGVIASGAAVLVIAGSTVAGQTLFGDERRDPTADPKVEQPAVPAPPPGTRWAGIGRVVLAVPRAWSDGATRCGQATESTVYFQREGPIELCRILGRHSSLAISDQSFRQPSDANTATVGMVDGHEVQTILGCMHAIDGPCVAYVAVPGLRAFFRVRVYATDAEERVQAIVDSLTVLPDGQNAVPDLGPEPFPPGDVDRLIADLVAAGFEPVLETLRCPPAAACVVGAWVEPRAGHVLSAGETVTIKFMPGFGEVDLGGLECPGGSRSTRFFNVGPPVSEDEARAQGWSTTARGAALQTISQPSGLPTPTLDPAVRLGSGVQQFTVRDVSRTVLSVVTVRELIPNAWAVTEISTCAD